MTYKDEIEVKVLSALGSFAGSFKWPKKHLDLLKEANKSTRGYYFTWKGKNALLERKK